MLGGILKKVLLMLALLVSIFALDVNTRPGSKTPPVRLDMQSVSYTTPVLDGFGGAGSIPSLSSSPTSIIVASAVTAGALGTYFVTADGEVLTTGNAVNYGSASQLNLFAPIIGIALTPDQKGYWLAATDGGIFTFGDAQFDGSMGGQKLNGPIIGIASTPDGKGYWLAASDGGIFTFGDAGFYGSMGGQKLNAAVVGISATQSGSGYYLVASDGGIFTFGDAGFYGSLGSVSLNAQIEGMTLSPSGNGYLLVGNDGGVFTFGDAQFYGSLGAQLPNTPVSQIISVPGTSGYWLLSPDSVSYNFTANQSERTLPSSIQVVNAAESQIGPSTQGDFCNPYGPCEEWCALFASWAWNHAGIPSVTDGFTGDLYAWAAGNTSVIPGNGTPAEGDIVFYGTGPQSTSTSVHDGIVVQTWPDGSLVTIEGDSGPGPGGSLGVTVNGPFQAQRSFEVNGDAIYGYGEP